jgi:hypothetical protein
LWHIGGKFIRLDAGFATSQSRSVIHHEEIVNLLYHLE